MATREALDRVLGAEPSFDTRKCRSSRLSMRPAERPPDLAIVADLLTDPGRTLYFGFPRSPLSHAEAMAFLAERPPWIVATVDDNRPVFLTWIDPTDANGCALVHSLSTGVAGPHLVVEAATLAAHVCFARLGIRRLWTLAAESNKPAAWLAEQVGFAHEGVLREAALVNGRPEDYLIFGLLRGDLEG